MADEHHERRSMDELAGLFEALVEHSSDILTIVNDDGTIRYSSPSANEKLGYVRGSRRGDSLFEFVHPDDRHVALDAIAALRASPEETAAGEVRLAHADGSWRVFASRGKNLLDDPAIRGFLFTSTDITETKELENRLAHEVLHDTLTGLPNRDLITALALAALARATRRSWTTVLMIIDIDHFRSVNDAGGFDSGDQVLIEVGARLDRAFREEDGVGRAGNVGRFAGDEFVVLCEQVDERRVTDWIRPRLRAVFREPFTVFGRDLAITASAGVALAPPGSNDFDALLHEAESAVRLTKERGGDGCELYDDALRQAEVTRDEARRSLQAALDREEMRLFFQPKVSLASGLLVGVEALLRWEHPQRGLVPPLEFIPLAEETGLIVPIGAWVIEEACRQASTWHEMFGDRKPLKMCVNVSSRQFGPQLVETVVAALAATGLPPEHLGLELTESILMADVESAITILDELKELGVSVAVDDFGTGYSSLAYLKQFHLDELKIDKSFVDGLGVDANDSAIVTAVIALAHALDLGVVAEGVETAEQVERLRSLGCDMGQGYLFARPGPADTIEQLLRAEAAASWRSDEVDDVALERPTTYRPERVLVVDDAADIRQLSRITLSAVGFEVHEAGDGREALDAARRLAPDCILLDVMMPEMDGLAACRELRGDPATSDCTIVLLTANAGAADKIAAFSAGADDYIVKPFSSRDLAQRLQAAMRQRRELAAGGPRSPETS